MSHERLHGIQELASAVTCKLSGEVMRDPVIVLVTTDPTLRVGMSYEKSALKKHLGDCHSYTYETRYGPNDNLRDLIRCFLNAARV